MAPLPQDERERAIARDRLADVVQKLEEALRLQRTLGDAPLHALAQWTSLRKEFISS